MRTLIIGGGGREHALAALMRTCLNADELYIAPGNGGTIDLGTNLDIKADDLDSIVAEVAGREIGLVIVGPEAPLVAGLVDRLRDAGVPTVGPTAAAAQLEGSKSFAKDFMLRHGIPTASYQTFSSQQLADALSYIDAEGAPIVVKASGLAAGKGAIVCETVVDARDTVRAMLEDDTFGLAGNEIVVESFMEGEEASLFVLSDGEDYVLLPAAQDHKRIGDGDVGPNTGGMGAYAPAPILTEDMRELVRRQIIDPTLDGMRADGIPYTGVLYVGLMITTEGPRVVEFNCRFGDPEAQVVLPLITSDPVDLFMRMASGGLDGYKLEVRQGYAASIVLASEGYPGSYPEGKSILGIEEACARIGTSVYQAGTVFDGQSHQLLTSGGRVLAVTGVGESLREAIDAAYDGVKCISFDGVQFRRDIGEKGLRRLEKV